MSQRGPGTGWPGRWLFVKQYRQLLQFGTFWRLRSPFEGNETAWMTVSPDRSTALVGDYRGAAAGQCGIPAVCPLAGLDPDRLYQVTPASARGPSPPARLSLSTGMS